MKCGNYENGNLQIFAFEMKGRQTFVDFYFILTKIEVYKNLPNNFEVVFVQAGLAGQDLGD